MAHIPILYADWIPQLRQGMDLLIVDYARLPKKDAATETPEMLIELQKQNKIEAFRILCKLMLGLLDQG